MRRVSKQIDIFAAIDQALDDAVDRGWVKEDPPYQHIEPMRVIPGDPEGDALLARESTAAVHADIANSLAGMDAAAFGVVEPPSGDTATMTAGQLVAWCRAAEMRCQWAFNKTAEVMWGAKLLDARDFYVKCRILLQLSLERTHAALFLLPWRQQVAAVDVDTARAIDFIQGAIRYANATTPFDKDAAGAMLRPAHGRLSRLGLIPADAPLVAGAPTT